MNLVQAIQILEIKECASLEDVKKAFYALAHRTHPDKNTAPDAAEAFREILDAYQFCLNHPDEIAKYFEFKTSSSGVSGDPGLSVKNVDDIFLDMFGLPANKAVWGFVEPQKIILTLKECLVGGEKSLRIELRRACSICRGRGTADSSEAKICRRCFGKGRLNEKVCVSCGGRGRQIRQACQSCGGWGHIGKKTRARFQIPRGILPNETVFLDVRESGDGKISRVETRIEIVKKGIFEIDHYDLLCDYFVNFSRHKTDGVYRIRAPQGERPLAVAKSARAGDVVTIKGEGLYKDATGANRGDLKVTLREKPPGFWRRMNRLIRRGE